MFSGGIEKKHWHEIGLIHVIIVLAQAYVLESEPWQKDDSNSIIPHLKEIMIMKRCNIQL